MKGELLDVLGLEEGVDEVAVDGGEELGDVELGGDVGVLGQELGLLLRPARLVPVPVAVARGGLAPLVDHLPEGLVGVELEAAAGELDGLGEAEGAAGLRLRVEEEAQARLLRRLPLERRPLHPHVRRLAPAYQLQLQHRTDTHHTPPLRPEGR